MPSANWVCLVMKMFGFYISWTCLDVILKWWVCLDFNSAWTLIHLHLNMYIFCTFSLCVWVSATYKPGRGLVFCHDAKWGAKSNQVVKIQIKGWMQPPHRIFVPNKETLTTLNATWLMTHELRGMKLCLVCQFTPFLKNCSYNVLKNALLP